MLLHTATVVYMTISACVGIVLANALHKRGPIGGGADGTFAGKDHKCYRRVTCLCSSARATEDHDRHENKVVMNAVYFLAHPRYFRLADLRCPQT